MPFAALSQARAQLRACGKIADLILAQTHFLTHSMEIPVENTRHRSFVLVHGAWCGAFIWRDVLHGLRALGYTATAPTLTGLGERSHILNDKADLDCHIEDVVRHIEMEDLRNITLVGSSYGGTVITGVLARMPERISKVVYLDAYVPDDGQALVNYGGIPDLIESWAPLKQNNLPLPSIPLSVFGVTDRAMVEFLEPRLTHQPWRTFYQPVKALKVRPDIPFSYVVCTGNGPSPFTARLAEMEADPTMRVIKIDSSHFCMMTAVEETITALIN
jgi:pimeloyl-ACP methyl ester carboxylesterase